MKILCRQCDICGAQMGRYECQCWVRPRILWGVPALRMKRMDICDKCYTEMQVLIRHPELIRQEKDTCPE